MESLEQRHLLAITVDNPIDELDIDRSPGDTSLREAIFDANSAGDTINFDPTTMNGATITLLHGPGFGEIEFGKNLTIDGGTLGITIDADDPDDDLPPEEQERGNGIRIFHITDPIPGDDSPLVTLKGLTLTGGDPSDDSEDGNGGAIYSERRKGDILLFLTDVGGVC
jgi:hypothetical protein